MTEKKKLSSSFGKWGWITILVCMLVYFIGGAVIADGLNIYVTALSDLRGWQSATMLSWSTYSGWISVVFTIIFTQIIAKRKNSSRMLMFITLLIGAVAIYIYGHSTSFGGYVFAIIISTVAYVGYGSVAPNTIQTSWFPKKKGLALGWSTIGFPLCTMIFPITANWVMGWAGVEGLFTVIAVFILVAAILCFLLIRSNPEDRGCTPDNLPLENQAAVSSQPTMTQTDVLKTRQVWLIGIALGLLWLVTAAIVSRFIVRIIGIGYERNFAVKLMALMGFFGIFGSYLWGLVDQKIGTKKASLIYAVWYIIALLLLIAMDGNGFLMYLAVFMVGVSVGGICNLIPSFVGTIYGRENFRVANSVATPITFIVKSSAYLYMGYSIGFSGDLVGSYLGLMVICAVAFVLILLIKPLKHT